jgi:hypothetical protein
MYMENDWHVRDWPTDHIQGRQTVEIDAVITRGVDGCRAEASLSSGPFKIVRQARHDRRTTRNPSKKTFGRSSATRRGVAAENSQP